MHELGPLIIRTDKGFDNYCTRIKAVTEVGEILDLFDITASLLAIATSNLELLHVMLPAADIYESTGNMDAAKKEALDKLDETLTRLEKGSKDDKLH
jgi:hypothetical protein